jgi:hypothetical protein
LADMKNWMDFYRFMQLELVSWGSNLFQYDEGAIIFGCQLQTLVQPKIILSEWL